METKWAVMILFFIVLIIDGTMAQQCGLHYQQKSFNHETAVQGITSKIVAVALRQNKNSFEVIQEPNIQILIGKARRDNPNYIKVLKERLNMFEQERSLQILKPLEVEQAKIIRDTHSFGEFKSTDISHHFKVLPYRMTTLMDGTILAETRQNHFTVLKPDIESKIYKKLMDVELTDQTKIDFFRPLINGGAVAVYETSRSDQHLIFFEPGNFDLKKARKSDVFLDYYRQYSLGDSISSLKVLRSGRIAVVLDHGRFLIYSEGVNHQGIFSSPYQTASFTKLGPDQINGVVELPNGDLLTFHDLSNFSKGFLPGSYIQYWAYNQSTQGYFPKKRFHKNIDYIREVRHLQNGSILTFSHYQIIIRTWDHHQMEFTERNLDFKNKDGNLEKIVDVAELDDGQLVVAFENGYRLLRFNATVGQYEILETINVNLPNQLITIRNNEFITIEDRYNKVKQWKP